MKPSVWDFLIALNISTHQIDSYLYIRINICWQRDILNLHLVSITLFDRHTGENMLNVSAIFFYCICLEWQNIIVGIATDGTRSMTGCIQGLTTRCEKGLLPGLMWFWCGVHHPDLLLRDFFKTLLDENFYSTLTVFIAYLC